MAKQKKKKTKNIKPFDEQDTRLAGGFVKKIEDVPFVSEQELNKAINIIDKTSGSRSESRRRKSNLLNDVTGKGFL